MITTEKIASNYYPVTSWAYIRDEEKKLQLTVMPDRAQGGSSLSDGSLELMVHRRLTMDDHFGVDEALNEPGVDGEGLVVRGKHTILIGSIEDSIRQMRLMSKTLTMQPVTAFVKHSRRSELNFNFAGLKKTLPENVHLLTLEPWNDERVLVR